MEIDTENERINKIAHIYKINITLFYSLSKLGRIFSIIYLSQFDRKREREGGGK